MFESHANLIFFIFETRCCFQKHSYVSAPLAFRLYEDTSIPSTAFINWFHSSLPDQIAHDERLANSDVAHCCRFRWCRLCYKFIETIPYYFQEWLPSHGPRLTRVCTANVSWIRQRTWRDGQQCSNAQSRSTSRLVAEALAATSTRTVGWSAAARTTARARETTLLVEDRNSRVRRRLTVPAA